MCKNGTFTENRLYLGTRFPAWLRALVPTKALYIREKYYNCYPYSFCSYHSELFSEGLDFTIESLHVENDVGRNSNIYGDCTDVEKREMKLQIVDITNPVESTAGVFQGDPTARENIVDGRGPLPKSIIFANDKKNDRYWFDTYIEEYKTKRSDFLRKKQELSSSPSSLFAVNKSKFANVFQRHMNNNYQQEEFDSSSLLSMSDRATSNFNKYMEKCENPPLLCIYKRSKVHITGGLPFASAVEEAAQNSTVRDLAVHSFRNLFVWLPQWQAMSHGDITEYLSQVGGAV